jgi:hypothetical protein
MSLFRVSIVPVCLCLSACVQASGQPVDKRVQAENDKASGKLTRLEYDGNSNGKPDTWAFMDGTRLIRLEADENEDGKMDRWEYYAAAQAAPGQPVPERIERATRMDGRISRREFFEAGKLARIDEDTDGDGADDKWETYTAGVLTMMALDTEHRGKPDRRLIYKPDGSLDRVEVDPTGSGRFQPLRP